MNAVVGDEMGPKEIGGVAEMDQGIILDAGPGEEYPDDKPERQDWDYQTISSIDQRDHLSVRVETNDLRAILYS